MCPKKGNMLEKELTWLCSYRCFQNLRSIFRGARCELSKPLFKRIRKLGVFSFPFSTSETFQSRGNSTLKYFLSTSYFRERFVSFVTSLQQTMKHINCTVIDEPSPLEHQQNLDKRQNLVFLPYLSFFVRCEKSLNFCIFRFFIKS